MKVCSIDQSISSTGIVLFELETETLLEFNLFKTVGGKTGNKDKIPMEYRIYDSVNRTINYIKSHDCDFVVLEGLSMNNINSVSSRPLGGLFYCLLTKLIENQIDFEYYPPTEIKKFMASNVSEWSENLKYKNARASKEELGDLFVPDSVMNAFKEYGAKKSTGLYDLTDAYAIGRYKMFLEHQANNCGIEVLHEVPNF